MTVARLSDGEHAGKLHIVDGGTRWLAQMRHGGPEGTGDPEYVFTCTVQVMTEKEAAGAFMSHNDLSQKPSAYFKYKVGLRAEEPNALAIKAGVDLAGVTISESPGNRQFAAVAAAARIVEENAKLGTYEDAGEALGHVLDLTIQTYGADQSASYDADLIQAYDRLIRLHGPSGTNRLREDRLVQTTSRIDVQSLRAQATMLRSANSGGSVSRSNSFAKILADRYNSRLAVENKIWAIRESELDIVD